MTAERRTTPEEAREVGDQIGVDWGRFDLEQFRAGMDVEYEHGSRDPQTDVTGDDPIVTGKIALAHMKEFPDYYERLRAWSRRRSGPGPTARAPSIRDEGFAGLLLRIAQRRSGARQNERRSCAWKAH